MAIRIAPTLAEMSAYPYLRLEEARRALVARGIEVIDFGKGDPNEPTEVDIRTQCVNLPPVALESCRRGGRSGAGEGGM